jgi:hypothetical protein
LFHFYQFTVARAANMNDYLNPSNSYADKLGENAYSSTGSQPSFGLKGRLGTAASNATQQAESLKFRNATGNPEPGAFKANETYARDAFKPRLGNANANAGQQANAFRQVYGQDTLKARMPNANANAGLQAQATRAAISELGQTQPRGLGLQGRFGASATNAAGQAANMRGAGFGEKFAQSFKQLVPATPPKVDPWTGQAATKGAGGLSAFAGRVGSALATPETLIPAADEANQALLGYGLSHGQPGWPEAARTVLSLASRAPHYAANAMLGRNIQAIGNDEPSGQAGSQAPTAYNPYGGLGAVANRLDNTHDTPLTRSYQAPAYSPPAPTGQQYAPPALGLRNILGEPVQSLDEQGFYTVRGENGATAKVLPWTNSSDDALQRILSADQYRQHLTGLKSDDSEYKNASLNLERDKFALEREKAAAPKYAYADGRVYQQEGLGAAEFNADLSPRTNTVDSRAAQLLNMIETGDEEQVSIARKYLAQYFPDLFAKYVIGNL